LKANGRVVRGYLAFTRRRARELAEEYGLNKGKFKGAFVRQVVPGARPTRPAYKAGDVVLP